MPVTEMVVTVAIVAGVTLLIVHLIRLATTALFHKSIRKLVERDPAQAQALITQLGERRTRSGDQRIAIILIAIAIAMAAGSLIVVDDPGVIRQGIAASLFPFFVGAGLLLHLHLVERQRRADGE